MVTKSDNKDERIAVLRQLFWDGSLSTNQFNLMEPEGREQAAYWIVGLLDANKPKEAR